MPRMISRAETDEAIVLPVLSEPVDARTALTLALGAEVAFGVAVEIVVGVWVTDGVTYLTITTPSAPALASAGVEPAPPPLPVFAAGERVGELLPPTVPPPTEL